MCSYPLIEPTVSPQNIMHVVIKVLKTILDSLGSNQDGIHIFQYVMNQQSFALISIPILNTLIYDYTYTLYLKMLNAQYSGSQSHLASLWIIKDDIQMLQYVTNQYDVAVILSYVQANKYYKLENVKYWVFRVLEPSWPAYGSSRMAFH